jgi:hypothetical protein
MIFYKLYEKNDQGERNIICEVIEYNDDGHVDAYFEDIKDMGIFIQKIEIRIPYSNLDEFKKNHLNEKRELIRCN